MGDADDSKSRDYLMWGVWGALRNLPANPKSLGQPALLALATEITDGWHPNLRVLICTSDPGTTFTVDVRTSVPLDAWQTTNVTVLGDAVHLMTAGTRRRREHDLARCSVVSSPARRCSRRQTLGA